ncbi:rpoC2 [Acrasis kona]|uniref:RpoC2 n=1 Tax=Acrasis kona TaxID=1008807 RepID=A0AAW2YSS4_9EUKA
MVQKRSRWTHQRFTQRKKNMTETATVNAEDFTFFKFGCHEGLDDVENDSMDINYDEYEESCEQDCDSGCDLIEEEILDEQSEILMRRYSTYQRRSSVFVYSTENEDA